MRLPARAVAPVGGVLAGLAAGMCVRALGAVPRWELAFASANDLGAMAAALLPAAAVVWLLPLHRRRRFALRAASAGLAVGCLAALLGSCSRGGLIAAVVAAGVLAACRRRRLALAIGLALLAGLAVAPRAGQRMAALAGGGDPSLATRSELLQAGLAMYADHPGGVGGGAFAATAERWYLPSVRERELWHPLNDVLELGCAHGWPAAWGYVAVLCLLAAVLIRRARDGDPVAAVAGAAVAVIAVAGCFTALLRDGGPIGWVAGILASAALAGSRPGFPLPGLRAPLLAGAAATACALAVLHLAAAQAATAYAWRPTASSPPAAQPRWAKTDDTVLVLMAADDRMDAVCRQVLRPLAAGGVHAVALQAATAPPTDSRGMTGLVLRGASVPPGLRCEAWIVVDADPALVASLAAGAAPVLAIHGTQVARPDPAPGVSIAEAPLPLCWPRCFPTIAPAALAWIAGPGRRTGPAARQAVR